MHFKSLKVGLVGLGNMGRHHARLLAEMGCLVAICDKNETLLKQTAETYSVPFASTDYQALLDQVDLVFIVAPTSLHESMIRQAYQKKVAVFVEKPLTADAESAQKLKAEIDANHFVSVGFIERFNPVVLFLKQALASGQFGPLTHLHLQRHAPKPAQITDVNILQDTTVHDIDLAAFILDAQPTLKHAHLANRLQNAVDDVSLCLKSEDVLVNIESHWMAQERIRQVVATTTQARFVLDLLSRQVVVWSSEAIQNPIGQESWQLQRELYRGYAYELKVLEQEPLKAEIEANLTAFLNQEKPPMNMHAALYPLEIVAQASEMA